MPDRSSASRISPSACSHSAGSPSALSGLVANANRGVEAEPAVGLADLLEHRLDLVGELVGADVDVGVVLDELAHAGQARQRPRSLVAVEAPELVVPQRQVAVRAQVRAVDERRLGAVHRLEREALALDVEQEHVVGVQRQVARLEPQLLVDEDRRAHLV